MKEFYSSLVRHKTGKIGVETTKRGFPIQRSLEQLLRNQNIKKDKEFNFFNLRKFENSE